MMGRISQVTEEEVEAVRVFRLDAVPYPALVTVGGECVCVFGVDDAGMM